MADNPVADVDQVSRVACPEDGCPRHASACRSVSLMTGALRWARGAGSRGACLSNLDQPGRRWGSLRAVPIRVHPVGCVSYGIEGVPRQRL
jgi:hypothetical protein